jgi:branched-chain amino acid transport system ATP-binding protein
MSGGEQQMLAIGRALMSEPKLLCIDEPSTGLAPISRAEVFEKIRKISDLGLTVLLVEQEVSTVFHHDRPQLCPLIGQNHCPGNRG